MKSRAFSFIAILFAVALSLFLIPSPALAQDSTAQATFKVSGNCGQCKKRIEKAAKADDVKLARWDTSTKMLTVAYDPGKITLDSLQRRIAAAGHDTERYKAADSTYASLPKCCLYRDGGKTH